ncbi:hypothetical protein [Methylobacterium sp. WL19]|uniref:hypothetical protein n=1 Tax=Methylobacterium sp. WL19 TaxID=2603896 RepID=UPI0011C82344|nr:hypothetical protein [Methylobacterium sp. WL19]TXN33915.1 hypothetical protein FV220_00255 [Methylobacterium sp. WL19]
MSNAPHFDPLNASSEEEADMVRGYREAGDMSAVLEMEGVAYEHGWRMRRNDMAGVVDADQRNLARRYLCLRQPISVWSPQSGFSIETFN